MAAAATLIETFASAPAFQQALRKRAAKKGSALAPTALTQAVPEAHPLLAALAVLSHPGRTWLVCHDSRAQERLFPILQQWLPDALFCN